MTAHYVHTLPVESQTSDAVGSGSLVTVATVALVVVTTAYIFLSEYWWSFSLKRKLNGRPPVPRGSFGLPLVGESLKYLSSRRSNSFLSFLETRRAKYGPFFKTSLFGYPTVVMDPPAGNKFLFVNEGKLVESSFPAFVARLLGPDSLTFKTGEDYTVSRHHIAAFLSPDAIVRYLSRVEQSALHHLAIWQEQEELTALDFIKMYTFGLMADLCMSLKAGPELDELMDVFKQWGSGIMQLPVNLPGFPFHRALKARSTILILFGKVIARRRQELKKGLATPTQDVLSHLLTQPDQRGRFNTDNEIKDNILLLMFAGFDTSSSALTMAIQLIAKHPDVYIRLKEEHDAIAATKQEGEPLTIENVRKMKYSWRVVQETMRLYPIMASGFRQATTDFEYNGHTILKGWKLMWTSTSSHYDPKTFINPHEFNPSRFEGGSPPPYTYLPFGGGPRFCPGNEFAKMEMVVFIHYLVRRLEWSLIDPNESIILNPFPQTPKGTPIKVQPRLI